MDTFVTVATLAFLVWAALAVALCGAAAILLAYDPSNRH